MSTSPNAIRNNAQLVTKLGDSATPDGVAIVVRQLFQTVINECGADKDTQTLVKLFERNAGVSVAPQRETAALTFSQKR